MLNYSASSSEGYGYSPNNNTLIIDVLINQEKSKNAVNIVGINLHKLLSFEFSQQVIEANVI